MSSGANENRRPLASSAPPESHEHELKRLKGVLAEGALHATISDSEDLVGAGPQPLYTYGPADPKFDPTAWIAPFVQPAGGDHRPKRWGRKGSAASLTLCRHDPGTRLYHAASPVRGMGSTYPANAHDNLRQLSEAKSPSG